LTTAYELDAVWFSLCAMMLNVIPSVLWHCWLGGRKVIRPVKKLGVGLLVVTV